MRGVKAEGGWGVVCTEETEIHPTSDDLPGFELRLWDDDDIPPLALMPKRCMPMARWPAVELVP